MRSTGHRQKRLNQGLCVFFWQTVANSSDEEEGGIQACFWGFIRATEINREIELVTVFLVPFSRIATVLDRAVKQIVLR